MEEILKNITIGYSRIFPELLDRYHKNNDNTIVELTCNKYLERTKGIVDINKTKIEIIEILNNNFK
jgi:hypothetical protein